MAIQYDQTAIVGGCLAQNTEAVRSKGPVSAREVCWQKEDDTRIFEKYTMDWIWAQARSVNFLDFEYFLNLGVFRKMA